MCRRACRDSGLSFAAQVSVDEGLMSWLEGKSLAMLEGWDVFHVQTRTKGDSLRWCVKINSDIEPKGVELTRGKIYGCRS